MKKTILKTFSTLCLIVSLFAINVMGARAASVAWNYADGKNGVGDKLYPIFPMITEGSQTPSTDDGSFIQAIAKLDATNNKATVTATLSNVSAGTVTAQQRTDVVVEVYFDKVIGDNFDIAVTSAEVGGVAVTNPTLSGDHITWSIGTLDAEATAKLIYTLTLKDNYEKSILNTNLSVFSKAAVNAAGGTTVPVYYSKADTNCTIPMFKLSLTENPKTDINLNYIIVGVIGLSAVGLVAYLNKNNKFSKI